MRRVKFQGACCFYLFALCVIKIHIALYTVNYYLPIIEIAKSRNQMFFSVFRGPCDVQPTQETPLCYSHTVYSMAVKRKKNNENYIPSSFYKKVYVLGIVQNNNTLACTLFYLRKKHPKANLTSVVVENMSIHMFQSYLHLHVFFAKTPRP